MKVNSKTTKNGKDIITQGKININFLARKLRHIRLSNRFTQTEAAYQCRLNPAMYAFYEQGIRLPNLQNFRRLCKGLNVSADELLDL